MTDLPPDLSRLGDVLEDAVARDGALSARRARARRRVAGTGLLTALAATAAVAASGVSPLGAPAQRQVVQVAAAPAFGATLQVTVGCDQPRGVRFTPPRGCVVLRPQAQAAR
jgi:hypothetical protein